VRRGAVAAVPDPLPVALFGKVRRSVLGLLFGRADEALHLREIVRRTGCGVGAVQREVRRLSAAGILRLTRRGNQALYQPDPACPLFPELKSLMVKTAGVADVLRRALATVAQARTGAIRVAFLFGSLAAGEERGDSDVDVFVVGDVAPAEVSAALYPLHVRLRREVNAVVYPPAELAEKLSRGNPFLDRVISGPKMFLIGSEDELAGIARVGEKRLAPHARRNRK